MATAAVVLGLNVRTRRAYLAALEDRAAQLERERDQQGRLAAAAERARIAREMHDIVAHNLSVMIALADGAGYMSEQDPKRAAGAMEQVSETGRHALDEMRRLLGVLREDEATALAPQPGLADLEPLLERLREAGLHAALETSGEPVALGAGAELTVYRLVQAPWPRRAGRRSAPRPRRARPVRRRSRARRGARPRGDARPAARGRPDPVGARAPWPRPRAARRAAGASRPARGGRSPDTCSIAPAARFGSLLGHVPAPSASAIITERLWATMSCISRAIRARSAAAASRPCCSRSRSSCAARSSSAAR